MVSDLPAMPYGTGLFREFFDQVPEFGEDEFFHGQADGVF